MKCSAVGARQSGTAISANAVSVKVNMETSRAVLVCALRAGCVKPIGQTEKSALDAGMATTSLKGDTR
jgi:hypothetical protein